MTSEWIRHYVLYNMLWWLWVHLWIQLWYQKDSLNSDFRRQFVLAILLRCIELLSLFDCSSMQTLCVSEFTVCQFGVHLAMKQSFKQTSCVSYYTKILQITSIFRSVNKSVTMCWALYCVSYEYIWAFNCDIRKTNWTVI